MLGPRLEHDLRAARSLDRAPRVRANAMGVAGEVREGEPGGMSRLAETGGDVAARPEQQGVGADDAARRMRLEVFR